MQGSRGTVTPYRLFSARDLGFGNPEPYVDRVIETFLGVGEAVAARWIQMPKGILILQMTGRDPASGAIYVYDRVSQDFYMLSFDGADDNLSREEFSQLFSEYNLIRYAERPELLKAPCPGTGVA